MASFLSCNCCTTPPIETSTNSHGHHGKSVKPVFLILFRLGFCGLYQITIGVLLASEIISLIDPLVQFLSAFNDSSQSPKYIWSRASNLYEMVSIVIRSKHKRCPGLLYRFTNSSFCTQEITTPLADGHAIRRKVSKEINNPTMKNVIAVTAQTIAQPICLLVEYNFSIIFRSPLSVQLACCESNVHQQTAPVYCYMINY